MNACSRSVSFAFCLSHTNNKKKKKARPWNHGRRRPASGCSHPGLWWETLSLLSAWTINHLLFRAHVRCRILADNCSCHWLFFLVFFFSCDCWKVSDNIAGNQSLIIYVVWEQLREIALGLRCIRVPLTVNACLWAVICHSAAAEFSINNGRGEEEGQSGFTQEKK